MMSAGLHDQRLSAQDMISCARRTKKCESGNLDNAFNQLREEGVVDEECFPYSSSNGEVTECSQKCSKPAYRLASVCATAGEGGLMREIKNNGPIAAVMYLFTDFLVYKGGIYEPHITATKLNAIQAVEIVGWGVNDKEEGYWIVKNSWGKTWGVDRWWWVVGSRYRLAVAGGGRVRMPWPGRSAGGSMCCRGGLTTSYVPVPFS